MTHIIIPRTSPVKSFALKVFVLVLLGGLIWSAYELGRSSLLEKYLPDTDSSEKKTEVLIEEEAPIGTNEYDLLLLEKKYQIELEACQILKDTLEEDQQKIMELEKDLAFYKAIMEPATEKDSIYLQSLEIVPILKNNKSDKQESDNKNQTYQFKFIVAQKMKKRTQTKGTISLNIRGKQGEKNLSLSISSLLQEKHKKQKSFNFSFKYFIEFKGVISLPEGFQPQAIDTIIKITKKKSSIILNDLLWTDKKGLKYVGK